MGVGSTDQYFTPAGLADDNRRLYGQARFFFSQFWDVRKDLSLGARGGLAGRLSTNVDERGVLTYANEVNSTVNVFPAWDTVPRNCTGEDAADRCCRDPVPSSCDNDVFDRQVCSISPLVSNVSWSALVLKTTSSQVYFDQAVLYASSLGVPGRVAVAPTGSDHGYIYDSRYVDWLAEQVLQ